MRTSGRGEHLENAGRRSPRGGQSVKVRRNQTLLHLSCRSERVVEGESFSNGMRHGMRGEQQEEWRLSRVEVNLHTSTEVVATHAQHRGTHSALDKQGDAVMWSSIIPNMREGVEASAEKNWKLGGSTCLRF